MLHRAPIARPRCPGTPTGAASSSRKPDTALPVASVCRPAWPNAFPSRPSYCIHRPPASPTPPCRAAHAGLITYRETALLVSNDSSLLDRRYVALVVAHEMAHQWFGNLVTLVGRAGLLGGGACGEGCCGACLWSCRLDVPSGMDGGTWEAVCPWRGAGGENMQTAMHETACCTGADAGQRPPPHPCRTTGASCGSTKASPPTSSMWAPPRVSVHNLEEDVKLKGGHGGAGSPTELRCTVRPRLMCATAPE